MPISSVIIRCGDSDAAGRVAEAVRETNGTTLEHREDTNLVVIIETTRQDEEKCIWDLLESHEDVAKLELIYSNFEDVGGGTQ